MRRFPFSIVFAALLAMQAVPGAALLDAQDSPQKVQQRALDIYFIDKIGRAHV